ncbi:hypothetical protein GIB67_026550 [Kingdonia uniflora]|uniref:Uncharacterized protein n=1 Tax=Kingdonia uniflora TaxID=39325 RepID=A0A7J7PBZ4_9MAGN|nr:hypothetical protein GIB67_026550 [Kingdonia uniflora]
MFRALHPHFIHYRALKHLSYHCCLNITIILLHQVPSLVHRDFLSIETSESNPSIHQLHRYAYLFQHKALEPLRELDFQ